MFRIVLQPMVNQYEECHGSEATIEIDRFPFVLGRHASCDYQLDQPHISRWHCSFSIIGEQVWVRDLESRNGTYLNNIKLAAPRPVQSGDLLALGMYLFRVHLQTRASTQSQLATTP
jgi:pSer/pThr/pTyr-binding forkhead associated (FHA) protein